MPPELPNIVLYGVPLVVLVPALVQLAKSRGLPSSWAGVASIVSTGVILGLVELQAHEQAGDMATWLLASIVYGLAASGLYSQVKKAGEVMAERESGGSIF